MELNLAWGKVSKEHKEANAWWVGADAQKRKTVSSKGKRKRVYWLTEEKRKKNKTL